MSKHKPSYYGAFFWVAAISFIVPLVVAARAFHEVPLTTKPASHPDASGVDQALWDHLLKTYVDNGLVDYDGMSRDYLFRTYIRQLAECEPRSLTTTPDQLALLINAYNAFVIDGVITHHISDSVRNYEHNGKQFFDLKEHILAGTTFSLNELEHDLIRKQFHEPRIHVALVCAARGCPTIRPEAYTGRRVFDQLDDQSRLFANDPRYVAYDEASGELRLNPILQWYGDDWNNVGGYLPWLRDRVLDPELRDAISRTIEIDAPAGWFEYDWSLNSQSLPAASSRHAAKHADFGSGSIPNE